MDQLCWIPSDFGALLVMRRVVLCWEQECVAYLVVRVGLLLVGVVLLVRILGKITVVVVVVAVAAHIGVT